MRKPGHISLRWDLRVKIEATPFSLAPFFFFRLVLIVVIAIRTLQFVHILYIVQNIDIHRGNIPVLNGKIIAVRIGFVDIHDDGPEVINRDGDVIACCITGKIFQKIFYVHKSIINLCYSNSQVRQEE